jgi:type 1 glutamine amidotransferase
MKAKRLMALGGVLAVTLAVAVHGVGAQAPQGQGAAPAQGAGAGARGGGRGGAGGGVAPAIFTAADTNKDGMVTRAELMTAIEKWYADADSAKAGSITQDQLATALNAAFPAPAAPAGGRGGAQCGGNSPDKKPCQTDVDAMLKALPATAPAKSAKPHKVLVLGNAQGFVHSSISIAGATVEAMGNKYKTWTTTITYNPADINTENLKQYDLVFLASTTGCFLDAVPGQPAATKAEVEARRAALLAFVRGGKGLAGIHAATDSYHSTCPSDQPVQAGGRGGGRGANAFTPGGQLQTQIVTAAGKSADAKLTLVDLDVVANSWFDKMDTDKSGHISQADFATRFAALTPAPAGGGRGGRAGAGADAQPVARGSQRLPAEGSWPEFNKMIGGYFKFHWVDGTHIPVKIDDPKSPLNKAFVEKTVEASIQPDRFPKAAAGQGYEIVDETYTFAQDSFSRTNVHVLTSVDYDKMPQTTKDMEPAATARSDGDYALSYIRREGQGRVFYEANGHNEKIYGIPAMMQHVLAGIQYALGDLKADDSPSVKPAANASKK